jgi:IclR family acetate operon transcriptional repressor
MTAVIGKVLQIVDCLAADSGGPVSLADMTRRTGIPKPTLYRLLGDLVPPGIVEHGNSGYTLGRRLFELGVAAPRYGCIRDAARPHMEELLAATSETVHLAVLSGSEVLYLEKLQGRSAVRMPTGVGARMPAHCTALGKALLAHSDAGVVENMLRHGLRRVTPYTVILPRILQRQLDRARNDGLVTESEEARPGLGCIAAVILDRGKAPVAAISLAGNPRSIQSKSLASQVRLAADKFERDYMLATSAA